MKFILDENIGKKVAQYLRTQGYPTQRIREINPGIEDSQVLNLALSQNSILITLDKDFGQLIFKLGQKHAGVIFLRMDDQTQENVIKALNYVLLNHKDKLETAFLTLTETSKGYKVRL